MTAPASLREARGRPGVRPPRSCCTQTLNATGSLPRANELNKLIPPVAPRFHATHRPGTGAGGGQEFGLDQLVGAQAVGAGQQTGAGAWGTRAGAGVPSTAVALAEAKGKAPRPS